MVVCILFVGKVCAILVYTISTTYIDYPVYLDTNLICLLVV